MRDTLLRLLPWAVLALGLSTTWLAWRDARETARFVTIAHFQSLARQSTDAIVDRIRSYRDANLGGAGLFRASEEVTRAEWRQYVDSLDLLRRHPGANGIGYVERVPHAELEDFVARTRRDAAPSFEVHPSLDLREHSIIKYVEPPERNPRALGRDLAAFPELLDAMERARDQGEAVLSDRVMVHDGTRERAAFALFTPVYADDPTGGAPADRDERREQIVGWIYAPFLADDFIEGVFSNVLSEIRDRVDLALYSGDRVDPERTLYRERVPRSAAGNWLDELRVERHLHGLDHAWTLVARPGPNRTFFEPQDEASLILFGGGALSFALFGVMFTLQRTRRLAVELAEDMTRDLQARTRALSEANSELERAKDEAERAADTLLEQHESLARAEKLAAMGEVAGGLAHELRNPIAGMLMSLQNLQRESTDQGLGERLELMVGELHRLTRLLDDYLAPLRHSPESAEEVDLGRLIDELSSLLLFRMPPGIELVRSSADGLCWILPKDRVRQALLNLTLNAFQAMEGVPTRDGRRGRVELSAEIAELDGRRELLLVVQDEGPGFPEDLLQRSIQPFESGRPGGTGLGLAMVRRLARDLGGSVRIENRELRGARVELRFPDPIQ